MESHFFVAFLVVALFFFWIVRAFFVAFFATGFFATGFFAAALGFLAEEGFFMFLTLATFPDLAEGFFGVEVFFTDDFLVVPDVGFFFEAPLVELLVFCFAANLNDPEAPVPEVCFNTPLATIDFRANFTRVLEFSPTLKLSLIYLLMACLDDPFLSPSAVIASSIISVYLGWFDGGLVGFDFKVVFVDFFGEAVAVDISSVDRSHPFGTRTR